MSGAADLRASPMPSCHLRECCHHGRGGTITLRVDDAPPGFVAIEVADTGTGMSDEVKARLFEPYFTTKGEHGTGLGLSSVRDIVTSAGGQLVVQSHVGKGTTISLQLPSA